MLFVAALVSTLFIVLDSLGIRPWKRVRTDKVADLGTLPDDDAETRYYLIRQKSIIEGRLESFKGPDEQIAAVKKSLDKAVELFAAKDYVAAEGELKMTRLLLTPHWKRHLQNEEANRNRLIAETQKADKTRESKSRAAKASEKTILKKLDELEEKLSGISSPDLDTDDAWIYLDKTLSKLKAGKLEDARYFLREARLMVRALVEADEESQNE
jgi:hypothetical protein